ncbi:hypothetical protein DFH05DRAFT_1507623, partial [Lentinula detonsa]
MCFCDSRFVIRDPIEGVMKKKEGKKERKKTKTRVRFLNRYRIPKNPNHLIPYHSRSRSLLSSFFFFFFFFFSVYFFFFFAFDVTYLYIYRVTYLFPSVVVSFSLFSFPVSFIHSFISKRHCIFFFFCIIIIPFTFCFTCLSLCLSVCVFLCLSASVCPCVRVCVNSNADYTA